MKRLDALILKELIGPWVFGVAMFTVLLMAATFLGRINGYIAQGVGGGVILKLVILLLPAILVKTFAMALLLGALLAFGRLSGDSEITAVRAAGVSLYRIIAPVAFFSLIVAAFAFYVNEQVVPRAAREAETTMLDLASHGQFQSAQPVAKPQVENGRLVAMYGAENVDISSRTLNRVFVIAYDKTGRETFIMFADQLEFSNLQKWKIDGAARILSADGTYYANIEKGLWPAAIPQLSTTPEAFLASQTTDPDVWSMEETLQVIRNGEKTGDLTIGQIRDYQYKYWSKIALPLAAFIFGTLGAALGIRNARTGSATGFAFSVVIIFAYDMLSNLLAVYASFGVFPAYIASFTPIAVGLIASGVIIWRRNR